MYPLPLRRSVFVALTAAAASFLGAASARARFTLVGDYPGSYPSPRPSPATPGTVMINTQPTGTVLRPPAGGAAATVSPGAGGSLPIARPGTVMLDPQAGGSTGRPSGGGRIVNQTSSGSLNSPIGGAMGTVTEFANPSQGVLPALTGAAFGLTGPHSSSQTTPASRPLAPTYYTSTPAYRSSAPTYYTATPAYRPAAPATTAPRSTPQPYAPPASQMRPLPHFAPGRSHLR